MRVRLVEDGDVVDGFESGKGLGRAGLELMGRFSPLIVRTDESLFTATTRISPKERATAR
jgi:hypothetical protein